MRIGGVWLLQQTDTYDPVCDLQFKGQQCKNIRQRLFIIFSEAMLTLSIRVRRSVLDLLWDYFIENKLTGLLKVTHYY